MPFDRLAAQQSDFGRRGHRAGGSDGELGPPCPESEIQAECRVSSGVIGDGPPHVDAAMAALSTESSMPGSDGSRTPKSAVRRGTRGKPCRFLRKGWTAGTASQPPAHQGEVNAPAALRRRTTAGHCTHGPRRGGPRRGGPHRVKEGHLLCFSCSPETCEFRSQGDPRRRPGSPLPRPSAS